MKQIQGSGSRIRMGPKCKVLTRTLCFKILIDPLCRLTFSTQICHLVPKFATFLLQNFVVAICHLFSIIFVSKSVSAIFCAFHDVWISDRRNILLAGDDDCFCLFISRFKIKAAARSLCELAI